MRIADLGLQTLQRRGDIAGMKFTDIENNRLLVRQGKTQRHGTGNLAIEITPPLAAIIERCRDNIASPYLVHRRPDRLRTDHHVIKDHWSQIKPEMLSRTFQRLRDDLHLCDFLQPEQRPSFHEIRALGANLYEKAGVNPQRLLGHAEEKMTATYLSRHKIRYLAVAAGLEI